jgi:3-hydroxyisobutyrate dehydrogenase-like beta-hydroxyacid dehydrogenase
MNLGFIGVGQVGGTLARRFGRGDHQINLGTRNPEDGNVQALAKEIGPRAKLLPLQAVVASSDIIFGSSKEFVGEVRHRQFANCMKKHDSLSLIRVESV